MGGTHETTALLHTDVHQPGGSPLTCFARLLTLSSSEHECNLQTQVKAIKIIRSIIGANLHRLFEELHFNGA